MRGGHLFPEESCQGVRAAVWDCDLNVYLLSQSILSEDFIRKQRGSRRAKAHISAPFFYRHTIFSLKPVKS